MVNGEPSTAFNNSLIKAFGLLEHFSEEKPEWGVRELAQAMDANKSTVYRLLATLESLGVLRQDASTEKYSLGLKLFELGNRVPLQKAFVSQTHPELIRVAEEITETVHLGILKNEQVFMIDKVESHKGLKLNSVIGGYSPIHCTGLGKVLLAHQSSTTRRRILEQLELQAFTATTITVKRELTRQLDQIAAAGYALDREEWEMGLICLAVPVFNQSGALVAALSAAGPASRFRETGIEGYVQILRAGADRIRQKIGAFQFENI